MLAGPIYTPKNTQKALILLHGYGADGYDLFSLSQMITPIFPDMLIFSPNAPQPVFGAGYQWFSLDDFFDTQNHNLGYLETLKNRTLDVVPLIHEIIDYIITTYHLAETDIYVAGFSQGGIVAAQTVFERKKTFAGLILMSPVPILSASTENTQTPVIITRGALDVVIPKEGAKLSFPTLKKSGFSVSEFVDPYLEHGISESCLQHIITFIQNN